MKNLAAVVLLILILGCVGCAEKQDTVTEDEVIDMDQAGESFVELVLALGEHDDGYVDAYYGPEEIRTRVKGSGWTLEQIRDQADELLVTLETGTAEPPARREFLVPQVKALITRIDMLEGKTLSFDDESLALYGAMAPKNGDDHFSELIEELDARLPGEGSVQERYQTFRDGFVIPREKLDSVFNRAIEGCRERTAEWIDLPENETFRLEYVGDKPWSGYNWYQGGFESLIQVNTDYPIYIDRAIDLACHEGYPGHHVYNLLREKKLGIENGWVEHTIYPLYSPLSLIAEGSANYGIEMAFPGDEKTAFERQELYPLAGINPERADEYAEVQAIVEKLSYAGNEAARRYLDGEIDRDEAAVWLEKYALSTADKAQQRVRFFDNYRAYVINYNLGKDIVKRWVEAAGDDETSRWKAFEELLSSPLLPGDLLEDLNE